MQITQTTELKAQIRARRVAVPAPLSDDQQRRRDRMVRATQPCMFSEPTIQRFGPGYPKRLLHKVARALQATHHLLCDVDSAFDGTPESLIIAVDNHRAARELLTKAKRLPHTATGAKARALALDNESVAYEVLEVISGMVKRGMR